MNKNTLLPADVPRDADPPQAPSGVSRQDTSRRQELLQAAARLMRHKGYAATTIRDMAQAVGMSSGSPFCHFRSKQDILKEIVFQGMASVLTRAEQVTTQRLEPGRRLLALIQLHCETLLGHEGDFTAVMLREWPLLPEDIRQRLDTMMERYEAIWRDTIGSMQEAEHLRSDVALSTRLLLGSLNGTLHWNRAPPLIDSDTLAAAAAKTFLRAPADLPSSR